MPIFVIGGNIEMVPHRNELNLGKSMFVSLIFIIVFHQVQSENYLVAGTEKRGSRTSTQVEIYDLCFQKQGE